MVQFSEAQKTPEEFTHGLDGDLVNFYGLLKIYERYTNFCHGHVIITTNLITIKQTNYVEVALPHGWHSS